MYTYAASYPKMKSDGEQERELYSRGKKKRSSREKVFGAK